MWHSPSLLQYLWDGLMVGVCLVDHDGTILQMNVPGLRLLGWGAVCPHNVSFEEIICSGAALGEEDGVQGPWLLKRLKEEKIVCFPRVRLYGRQGPGCWVELKGVAVEDGGATQFLFMFRDLSSETRLAEDYSRLASIPEESPFPIIEVDAAGFLLYANPSMVRLMEDAQIGQDGFTTALPDQFPELAARCFSQGHLESNIEVQVGAKHYAWSFSSHPELGRLRGYGVDVTDSKRASAELSAFAEMLETKNRELDQALMKAEAATRAKAAFLATMSHEIRTPLNGVIGMAELLLNSTLDGDQQECTNIIRKSGEGLLAIINDILDFSKIESGHMALEYIAFNPLVLVEDVLDLFSERAYHKELDLAAYISPDIPRHLLGDPHRLRQILSNYISNAIKFTSQGSVLIEVGWLPLGDKAPALDGSQGQVDLESVPEGIVRFAVKDTGIGISQSMQEKIFEVFTQADSSMSRKFGGSGLGLAICKQLAELMNGRVGVESHMEKGATFWCDLPFQISVSRLDSPVTPRPRGKSDILVCASSNVSTEVVSRYLEDRGVRVIRVEQVEEATEYLEKTQAISSEILGIIFGRESYDDSWRVWHATGPASESSEFKVWGLAPFWLRKEGLEGAPCAFADMISMPIHRDQLYHCVFDEPEGPAGKNVIVEGDLREDSIGKTEHAQHIIGSDQQHPAQKKLPPSVLVVDDNPVNQKVAVGLFEKLGCQVYVAESGDQALILIQEYPVDVVMMDWELPGMDGFETARAIRELEETHRLARSDSRGQKPTSSVALPYVPIPIVGMTAHGHSERMAADWERVMDDCLEKPVHLEDLAKVLERWVACRDLSEEGQVSLGEPQRQSHFTEERREPPEETVLVLPIQSTIGHLYDYSAALDSLEGDEALLHSLFEIFLETGPKLVQELREALESEDRPRFQRQVHQLKGALFALNANSQAFMAESLEAGACGALFPELQHGFEAMIHELEVLTTIFRTTLKMEQEK